MNLTHFSRFVQILYTARAGMDSSIESMPGGTEALNPDSEFLPPRRPERNVGSWAMAQPTLPPDKTFRMVVKLVSTDGNELPFKGFVLIPEGRLASFENVALAARYLLARHIDALKDASQGDKVQTALVALGDRVSELEKVWDIPQ